MMDEFLTVQQAADIADVNISTIKRACAAARLKATKHGQRAWLIRRVDLDDWINNESVHKTGPKPD